MRSPSVLLGASELETSSSVSAGSVGFCHPIRIREPRERVPDKPQYQLMRGLATAEYEKVSSRAGESNQPLISSIRDRDWGIPGSL